MAHETSTIQEPTAEYWAQVTADAQRRMAEYEATAVVTPVSPEELAACARYNAAAPGEWVPALDGSGASRKGGPVEPHAVTEARTAYEAARTAWQEADAQMRVNTRARGTWRHDPSELRAVDALHKALSAAAQAYYKARFAAGLIQA